MEQPVPCRSTGSGDFQILPGSPLPLGVWDCCDGFNFALFSRHAEKVTLLIFEDTEAARPSLVVELDPQHHRTGDIWHVLIDGVRWGHRYAYRVDGPWAPEEGHRFNGMAGLIDPHGLAVSDMPQAGHLASVLVNRRFDRQGVPRPCRAWTDTVIYETHVRGLTNHASSKARHPGTFLGITEKIPYFLDLGITAVELMPAQEFDPANNPRTNPETNERLRDYWGYNTLAFCAPHRQYATGECGEDAVSEFKTMVRELHRHGIEIILDVVFNHTGEGNENGPTVSFRGIDNLIYYMLEDDKRFYRNFSGCGNTLNCNHPVVRDFVIDSLRYWASEMIGLRSGLANLRSEEFYGPAELYWFDPDGTPPDWHDSDNLLGALAAPDELSPGLCLLFNPGSEDRTFLFPAAFRRSLWHRLVDTALAPPNEIMPLDQKVSLEASDQYRIRSRSFVMLIGEDSGDAL